MGSFRDESRWSGRQGEEKVPRMDLEMRELLFVHLLRIPQLLMTAKIGLADERFSMAEEQHLEILWAAILSLVKTDHPDCSIPYLAIRQAVLAEAERYEAADAVGIALTKRSLLVEPEGTDPGEPVGLLYHAYKVVGPDDLDVKTGEKLLRRLFLERRVHDAHLRPLLAEPDKTPILADPTRQIEALAKAVQQWQGLTQDTGVSIRPKPGLFKGRQPWYPPGINFITHAIGGFADREMYGLIGPMGQGKTALTLQIAVAAARHIKAQHILHGAPLRDVYYLFYEMEPWEITSRFWASASQVHKDRIMSMDPERLFEDPAFTTNTTPPEERQHYEHELARLSNIPIEEYPGERERLYEAVDFLEDVVCLEGFSGDAGYGGVDEIAARISRRAEERKRAPAIVLIDYVNRVVRRYCQARELDYDKYMRHMIAEFVDGLTNKVNRQFDCSFIAIQQLAGRYAKLGPGVPIHHTDASESSMFAENLTYCGALGNRDEATGVQVLWHPKTRNTGRVFGHDLIKLAGHIQLFQSAGDRYGLANGAIIEEELRALQRGDMGRAQPRRRPRGRRIPTTEAEWIDTDTLEG